MKHSLLKTVVCGVLAAGFTANAAACSRVLWNTEETGTFVSRTMDWLEPTHLAVHNVPQGTEYKGHVNHNVVYTSKYDVTGTSTYGVLSNGVNSAGLGANVLFDNRMVLSDASDDSNVGVIQYLTHLLSQFATVEEAVEFIAANPAVKENLPGVDMALELHFSLQDIGGDSAVIEFRDGESLIWHGAEYNVMTNQPDFELHLANLERAQSSWGPKEEQALYTNLHTGGNINPEDRFIHASYYASHLKEPSSVMNGIMKLDGVPMKVPHDAPNRRVNGVMTGYATEYSITEHLQSGETMIRYQWGDNPTQLHYNAKEIQASGKNITFNLTTPGLIGEITEQIIASGK
ncbi:linear amide C-N hydrolase [Thaumasiovibrio sp. DFM-14]|uniref:linear amide C-N hydrolase n=1 Tax=Thaumasiovibrio sp. DFM-14 TaxID=3384792 RepID=UPI00399F06FE